MRTHCVKNLSRNNKRTTGAEDTQNQHYQRVITIVDSFPKLLLVFEVHWHGGRLHTTSSWVASSHRDTDIHQQVTIIFVEHPSQLASPGLLASWTTASRRGTQFVFLESDSFFSDASDFLVEADSLTDRATTHRSHSCLALSHWATTHQSHTLFVLVQDWAITRQFHSPCD